MLSCHGSVISKRVLWGDNNSRVVGDFGRDRGGGRRSREKVLGTMENQTRWWNFMVGKFKSGGFGRGRGRGRGSGRSRDGNERDQRDAMVHVTCVVTPKGDDG
ncbi:hypothetical protein Tco_1430820 [Tanacetum coccineum]